MGWGVGQDKRIEATVGEAVEVGYMTKAMLKKHGVWWIIRVLIATAVKYDPDIEAWYYDPLTGVTFEFDVMKGKPVGMLKERSRFELRWCPRGYREFM
jgi:hypothetical protein